MDIRSKKEKEGKNNVLLASVSKQYFLKTKERLKQKLV